MDLFPQQQLIAPAGATAKTDLLPQVPEPTANIDEIVFMSTDIGNFNLESDLLFDADDNNSQCGLFL